MTESQPIIFVDWNCSKLPTCNKRFAMSEHSIMILHMTRQLFVFLEAILAALLPVEATFAANDCSPIAVTSEARGDCGGCMPDERLQCQSYCLTLCQAVVADRASPYVLHDFSSLTYLAFVPGFPPLSNGGPEPPPPRILR